MKAASGRQAMYLQCTSVKKHAGAMQASATGCAPCGDGGVHAVLLIQQRHRVLRLCNQNT